MIVPVYLISLRRRHQLRPRAVIGAVARPLLGGFVAALVGVALMSLAGSDFGELVFGGAGIVVVYAVLGVSFRELRALPKILGRGSGTGGDPAPAT